MDIIPSEFHRWLCPITLTENGRVSFEPEENLLLQCRGKLYLGTEKHSILKSIDVSLTNSRFIVEKIHAPNSTSAFCIPLANLSSVDMLHGGFFARSKIMMHFRNLTPPLDLPIPFCKKYSALLEQHKAAVAKGERTALLEPLPRQYPPDVIELIVSDSHKVPTPDFFAFFPESTALQSVFSTTKKAFDISRGKLGDDLNRDLLQNLATLEGLDVDKLALQKSAAPGLRSGISRILQEKEATRAEINDTFQSADTDLQSLMDKAEKVVALTQKLLNEKEKNRKRNEGNDDNDDVEFPAGNSKENQEDYSEIIRSMSIKSMVSKSSDHFHEQLARELADTLPGPLRRLGGIVALPDVYCLVCKMRGTDLISPKDFFEAASLWKPLGLSLVLRRFHQTNVMVVQTIEFSPQNLHRKIVEIVRKHPSSPPCPTYEQISVHQDQLQNLAQRYNISNNDKGKEHGTGCSLEDGLNQTYWKNQGINAIQIAKLVNLPLPLLRQELNILVNDSQVLVVDTVNGMTHYYYNYFGSLLLEQRQL